MTLTGALRPLKILSEPQPAKSSKDSSDFEANDAGVGCHHRITLELDQKEGAEIVDCLANDVNKEIRNRKDPDKLVAENMLEKDVFGRDFFIFLTFEVGVVILELLDRRKAQRLRSISKPVHHEKAQQRYKNSWNIHRRTPSPGFEHKRRNNGN